MLDCPLREMLDEETTDYGQRESTGNNKQHFGSHCQHHNILQSKQLLEESALPHKSPAIYVQFLADGKPDAGRKFSLPNKQPSLAAGLEAERRRHSSVDKNSILSQYADHIAHKHVAHSSRSHKKSLPKLASFDVDKTDFYIPDAYLEAAKSPGSLREELKQLGTIDEYSSGQEEMTDLFNIIEDYGKKR